MPTPKLLAAAMLATASGAFAATPVYLVLDHSTEVVMDKAGALAVWREQLTDQRVKRLARLYPVAK